MRKENEEKKMKIMKHKEIAYRFVIYFSYKWQAKVFVSSKKEGRHSLKFLGHARTFIHKSVTEILVNIMRKKRKKKQNKTKKKNNKMVSAISGSSVDHS